MGCVGTGAILIGRHLWLLLIALAPFVGSFLGVLAVRLPAGRPVLFGRSACDSCGATLKPFDLVPLANWLWLRGRCRACGQPIDSLHPLMEIAAVLVVAWAASATTGWVVPATCVFGWLLLTLAAIDWRTYLLPDALTLLLALAGLVAAWFFDRAAFADHAIAAVAGFAAFAAIALAYRRLRGRDGLGLGDAKLLGALGAWVSWQGLPSVVLYAAVLGLAQALPLSFIHRGLARDTRIAFGAFLALGGWLVWLYGPLQLT
jgi:leader peptidase (prepilin peptidase)/N-methyltransferase